MKTCLEHSIDLISMMRNQTTKPQILKWLLLTLGMIEGRTTPSLDLNRPPNLVEQGSQPSANLFLLLFINRPSNLTSTNPVVSSDKSLSTNIWRTHMCVNDQIAISPCSCLKVKLFLITVGIDVNKWRTASSTLGGLLVTLPSEPHLRSDILRLRHSSEWDALLTSLENIRILSLDILVCLRSTTRVSEFLRWMN